MRFISKNNRVPLVMLTLLVVGYLLFWAYLLREGVIVQQWTYWRLGLLVVVVFLFIISQVSRNETFSIWTILGTIFVSWVAGWLGCCGGLVSFSSCGVCPVIRTSIFHMFCWGRWSR